MIFDGGVRAPRKILEAYMGEAVWPAEPPRAFLATMSRVVVMLFGQLEDQLKNKLP